MEQQVKTAKLEQFSNDRLLQNAVHEVLLDTFLKKRSGEDVQMKAARFVATELLEEAFAILIGYASENRIEEKSRENPGL